MDKDLRKRLEEAAENTLNGLNNNCYIHMNETTEDAYKDGFRDGAEYGYKEAIAWAKEWLKDLCDRMGFTGMTINETADDFEADMNKLMEE